MLNDLVDKRKKFLAESEQHKTRRNELNALASKYARERNVLNNQTREFVEEAQKHKELRDKNNEEVQALKEQRNEHNEKANELFEEIEAFKKEHGSLKNRGIKELQKQIEHLEFKQQTEVYSTDKERELIEKIKHLKAGVKEQEAELEQNKEMRTKLADAREFRRLASEIHKEVTEKAELAQQHHDLMVESYRKADKSRESADQFHQQFVEAQESADEEHKLFIACQKELRDYDKVISGLRQKTKKTKVTKEQKAVRKEAERIFQQFRGGEKLTTDDLLLLQRAKLI
ncbi:phosphoserine phosphatase [Methanoculleus sp. FWC-SCC1]|uniref:Phosphoserine phosphatase n=1 Tax=Methanoculleus frigidifontis TaxID=2584085 RepID=A0ABT8M6E9_9EURY|nr:phosphoserine phosphatase [Methanoculleus sp. FWC-SCC1]MDN7023515.1 phosphoserine phosphatase [Methanoculleus sp. FWC-SCC1]